MKTLFKGVATGESLTKMQTELTEAMKLIKEIHETPLPNNVALNGANPMNKGFDNNFNYQATEVTILEGMIKGTNDAMVKDKLGQELAMKLAKQNFNPQGGK
jgi:hypothetical protein